MELGIKVATWSFHEILNFQSVLKTAFWFTSLDHTWPYLWDLNNIYSKVRHFGASWEIVNAGSSFVSECTNAVETTCCNWNLRSQHIYWFNSIPTGCTIASEHFPVTEEWSGNYKHPEAWMDSLLNSHCETYSWARKYKSSFLGHGFNQQCEARNTDLASEVDQSFKDSRLVCFCFELPWILQFPVRALDRTFKKVCLVHAYGTWKFKARAVEMSGIGHFCKTKTLLQTTRFVFISSRLHFQTPVFNICQIKSVSAFEVRVHRTNQSASSLSTSLKFRTLRQSFYGQSSRLSIIQYSINKCFVFTCTFWNFNCFEDALEASYLNVAFANLWHRSCFQGSSFVWRNAVTLQCTRRRDPWVKGFLWQCEKSSWNRSN